MRSFDSRRESDFGTDWAMDKLLILNGHPESDGFNADLTQAYAAAASSQARVERIDLRSLRFDLVARREGQQLEPDLEYASQALLDARHVTWIFPNWWAGPPALVKGFVDRVFRSGFAFRYRKRFEPPERLLTGRSARLITTMDSPNFWYHLVQGRPLHKSFVNATLGFVGFAPIATTLFYEVRLMNAADRERALARVGNDGQADAKRVANQRPRPLLTASASKSA